jgi:hypothetical protein
MKRILESGQFSNYREGVRLDSASMEVANLYKSYFGKTTVFISHKHDDLEDLSGLIGFLEKNYNVKAYIDSKDSSMPSVTSGVTASKIKERIRQCDIYSSCNGWSSGIKMVQLGTWIWRFSEV